MANSTAPREILNILKQKDPSNTTRINSVYNAIFSNKQPNRKCKGKFNKSSWPAELFSIGDGGICTKCKPQRVSVKFTLDIISPPKSIPNNLIKIG
ncbi:hypothetical protein RHMOL_Rhmol08G0018300 [Rhododendron molle]|uniref:Uncharacterized protein n=1 Tax=Rhododendron molle TaxID=49168 RepID=A0ACC0MKQ3_RHOML|nr:hypothetical protein RHMOL_Rhmol08G0018300 [Rhododendron molle]